MPTTTKEPSITSSPEPVTEPVAEPVLLTLQQWCEIKSMTMGRSVEILSGFFRKMRNQGVDNLTSADWEAKFQQYKTAPAGRG